MKAAVLTGIRQIEIIDIPEPEPGPEDVLIDIRVIGLCGSDLNAYRGLMPLLDYPRILGHEIGGIVIGKGEAVGVHIQIGDQVTVSPYTTCGVCPACRSDRPNCCQFNETYGVQRDGALMDRLVTHQANAYVSRTLSLPELALVEPLSVGYHAANRGRVCKADTVLVLGCGAIGIGVIAAAAQKGATVIALDVDDAKLANAKRFGADYGINASTSDPLQAILDLTNDEGVQVAIEAVGLSQTYRLAVQAAAFAGRVVYVGYARQDVSFDTTLFVKKELDVLGSRNALDVFPAVLDMLENREYPYPGPDHQCFSIRSDCRCPILLGFQSR